MDTYKRKQEMMKLRFASKWTLESIAKEYNISRERVRQILGNTGHIAKRKTDPLRDKDFLEKTISLTNQEIANMLNTSEQIVSQHRGHFHHVPKGNGPVKKSFDSEIFASETLKLKGIPNKLMGLKSPYDILALDKIRIDVKVSHTPRSSPSLKTKNLSWRFAVKSGKKRDDADFYFCIIHATKEIFIIPAIKIPKKRDFITFCWPTDRPTMMKWQHYLDRYDLIRDFQL